MTREMRFGFEAIDITKEKNEFRAGRIDVMTVFFDISDEFLDIRKKFFQLQKFFPHITSNVGDDIPNGMHMGKNFPDIRKNVPDITEE